MTMDFSALEKKYDSFYAPTFEIDIDDGETFSPAQGQVSSVRIRTAIDRINRVSFTVGGVYDRVDSDFVGLDSAGLSVGSKLTARLGYGSATEPVVVGKITDVQPSFPEGDAPTVSVVAQDYRHAMSQSTGDESLKEETITGAAKTIGGKYGFNGVETGTGDVSELELKRLYRDAKSEYGFLSYLAKKFDYELFSRAGTMFFRRPPAERSPAASLIYGQGLRSFEVAEKGSQSESKTVKHTGVNHHNGRSVSGTSERSGEGDGGTVVEKAGMESDTEATQRSEATTTAMDRERTSDVTTLGLPDVQIGEWLDLNGLGGVGGQTYDGVYYVLSTTHTVRKSGYTTKFTVSQP